MPDATPGGARLGAWTLPAAAAWTLTAAALALFAVLAAMVAPPATLLAPATAEAASYKLDRRERTLLREVNRQRRRFGLPRLKASRLLARAADAHTDDLVRHHRIGHSSSDGTPFGVRIRRSLKARVFGEVVAYTARRASPSREARTIVKWWLQSPSHRRALLRPGFRRIGIGRGSTRHGDGAIATVDLATRDVRSR